jgi:hypothetical protein
MAQILRTAGFTIFIALIAVVTAGATASATSGLSKAEVWFVYTRNDGGFVQSAHGLVDHTVDELPCAPTNLPSSWHIITALEADLTRDGAAECVLLVWRPWEDWPIMRWSDSPSPIADHRDMYGDSAHIILIDLQGQSEVWAGSALAVPIVEIAVGDVNGDGGAELVALEGDYTTGRNGPARNVAVWRWNGFGFTLAWRSSPGRFSELSLIDVNDDGAQEILVR